MLYLYTHFFLLLIIIQPRIMLFNSNLGILHASLQACDQLTQMKLPVVSSLLTIFFLFDIGWCSFLQPKKPKTKKNNPVSNHKIEKKEIWCLF